MVINLAQQPLPCTHADYEHFNAIYNGFCYLIDHKQEQTNSIYSYKQAEVLESLEGFWPVFTSICQWFNMDLELTLDDARHAIKGFDAKDAAELCNSRRYKRMAAKKVIAFEEDRLLDLTRSLFDKIMVRLHRTFRMFACSIPASNIASPQNVPIVDVPRPKMAVTPAAAKPIESLNKTDCDILQAMAANPKANLLRVEIEAAAGYGRYAVTQSLKRLESLQLVQKTYGAGRQGWVIIEKGNSLVAELS